jgi:hypothetical protein
MICANGCIKHEAVFSHAWFRFLRIGSGFGRSVLWLVSGLGFGLRRGCVEVFLYRRLRSRGLCA